MCVDTNRVKYWSKNNIKCRLVPKIYSKQGRSSSIGAKILSFVSGQLTEDFNEENTEKESIQYGIPISYSPE